jgi:antitoxin (DNA-binding transcriptional repressor) of toxin-antitoxin stability system
MDKVQAKRQAVVITKRGKPVAKLVPIEKDKDDIFGFFAGKITIGRYRFSCVFARGTV